MIVAKSDSVMFGKLLKGRGEVSNITTLKILPDNLPLLTQSGMLIFGKRCDNFNNIMQYIMTLHLRYYVDVKFNNSLKQPCLEVP
jgi:hypothetical protein